MKYFSNFPSISYSLDDNDLEFKLIKNPLTRVRFVREILQNVKIFYEYDFSDSDSPEIIAHKLYEDPNRYWMVMFSNDLIDPYYDVPLKDADLDSLLVHKYGSVANAQSQIHHYERRTNIVTNKDGNISENEYVTELQQYSYDFDTGLVIENTLPTISNPVSISSESTEVANDGVIITKTVKDYAISNYDYELNLNEDKRKIKLVRSELVSEIETQFKSLLNR
jgi:hypothetical protein